MEIQAVSKMATIKGTDAKCEKTPEGKVTITIGVRFKSGGIEVDTTIDELATECGNLPSVVHQIAKEMDMRVHHEMAVKRAYERGKKDAQDAIKSAMEPKPEEPAPEAPKAE